MHSFFSHFKLYKIKNHDCLKSTIFLLRLVILICFTPTNIQALESNNLEGTSLSLLGIAIHSELRNDIYIGAMFAPTEIDDFTQLYDTSITKNMSLRFMQAYSNRKIARLWKHRIAMNNDKSEWQPLTKDIVKFSKIFKRPLKSGDEINLIYVPNVGTKIYLNGSMFLVISNPQFYSVLLNVWYGNVPPSKLFKTGITGNNTDYLQKEIVKQYENLESIPGRFDNDKTNTTKSINSQTSPIQKQSNSQVKINNTSSKILVSTLSQATLTKTLVEGFKPKLPQTVTQKETNTNLVERATFFKVDLELSENNLVTNSIIPIERQKQQTKIPIYTNVLSESQSQQTTTSEDSLNTLPNNGLTPIISANELAKSSAPTEAMNSITTTVEDTINNGNDENLDNALISGAYSREIVNIIKKNQTYPRKAKLKGHEGNLIISITLNAIGDIASLSLLQRSGSRYLDIGVLRQVKELEPFPPFPSSLNLELLVVEIPMRFSFTN